MGALQDLTQKIKDNPANANALMDEFLSSQTAPQDVEEIHVELSKLHRRTSHLQDSLQDHPVEVHDALRQASHSLAAASTAFATLAQLINLREVTR